MGVEDHLAVCDGCPQGTRARVPVASVAFCAWEHITMRDGPDALLCPRCQVKRERGWLVYDEVLECAVCGRNTVDNPDVGRWIGVTSADYPPRQITLCGDCRGSL